MPDGRTCANCGAALPSDAPRGFCPRCLYRLAMDESVQGPSYDPTPRVRGAGASAEAPAPQRLRQFGEYELLEEIGHGGMGVVYKARQRSLDRIVALKLLLFGPYAPPESVKRFRAEAVTTAALQHPNIVAIHEVGFSAGQHFIAMDFVEGRSLSALLQAGPWPARRAAGCVKQIAEAVHYAHEHGILHRDLKPANVLVDTNDQPRLTDFGLARRLEVDSELTASGQVLGSPNYMPPEQATGRRGSVSRRSDVYALGAILYHTLTGRPPFMAGGLVETVQQVLTMEPVSPRLLDPRLPADLETVCLKCLEKEPAKRYPTALALAEDLARYLNGQPVSARPIGLAGKVWRWCRRNPRLAGVGGIALLSVLLGFTGISWQWRRAESKRLEAEAERARAEAGELAARRNAYAADISAAQRALEDDDLRSAQELLDRYRPSRKPENRKQKAEEDLRGWEWRYLWACCQSDEEFTLCQYTNPVTALAGSRDGRWLAVSSGEGDRAKIDLWELPARKRVASVHSRCWPKAMAFSPVANLLAWGTFRTTNKPATLTLWDADIRREVLTVAQPDTVTAVAFSPHGKLLATFNADRDPGVANAGVNLWQADSGALATHFPAAKGSSPQAVLRFSPDGQRLAVGETTGRIRLLDWRAGREELLQGPREGLGVSALAFSPDGRLLASGCSYPDFAIGLWEMATLSAIGKLEGHRKPLNDLVFLPDSQVLVSASEDCAIRFWEVGEKGATRRLQGHLATVNCLALSPDGRVLLSAGEDGTVRGWDPVTRSRPVTRLTLPTRAGPFGGPFTVDGRDLITASKEDPVIAWDLDTGEKKESWPALGTNNLSVALSPDGRWLVVGDWAGAVKIWDCRAGRLVTNFVTLPERPLPIYALAFLTPRRTLYSAASRLGSGRVTVQRWEAPSWREVPVGSMDVSGATWWVESPDQHWQAFPHWDGRVQVWDLAHDRHITTFQAHSSVADKADFSPNGRWLATGGRDGLIKLWEVGSWRWEATLQAHLNLVPSLCFSPDSARLLTGTGSADEVARLWDLETRRTLLRLGHDGTWTSFVRFSPDGNTLVTIGFYGKVELWRAPTFEEIERRENEQE